MAVFYMSILVFGLSFIGVKARAVNISNAWFLPQEGFPVFYRYFNEKLTWNEAEAICGFHHADLLTVQTYNQMDTARAYLKEIDVMDNVWIGLRKESPEKPFSWSGGEKLLGDGYWMEPIPKTNEKLCAAIDPTFDFRWNSFYCRGPQVASFVCEMPVPDWAKEEDGCMITSLPSLTITYIPEMRIIQLLSDCGLDGTRRIACKGGVKRKEIVKRLSCDENAFGSTAFNKPTMDTVYMTDINNDKETTQPLKSLDSPQTRHKRNAATNSTTLLQTPEISTTVMSPHKKNFLNVPSHNFPHSPGDKNSAIQTHRIPSTESFEVNVKKTTATNKNENTLATVTNPQTVTNVYITQTEDLPTKSSKESLPITSSTKISIANKTQQEHQVPILIITGENSNSSVKSFTSENPKILLMIGEKEGLAEPYLVPMNEDIVINNPSSSPMEVIDVDLVEFDNLTTNGDATWISKSTTTTDKLTESESPAITATTITSAAATAKSPQGIHPLRIGQRNNVSQNATGVFLTSTSGSGSSTVVFENKISELPTTTTIATPTKIFTSATTALIKSKTTQKSLPLPEKFTMTEQYMEKESKEEESEEIPQRPNRGRLLTHSSHPSFYPYFLNRVLG